MNDTYSKAKELIKSNRDKLEAISKALLKYETLDAEDVKVILEGGTLDKPTVTDLIAAEQQKQQANTEETEKKKKTSTQRISRE